MGDTAFYAKRRSADHGNETRANSSEIAATEAASPISGAAGTRGAVNQLSKSVVREIRTPRSVGTGGATVSRDPVWDGNIPTYSAPHVERGPQALGPASESRS